MQKAERVTVNSISFHLGVNGVGKIYRSEGRDVYALRGISMRVARGEFVAVTGRSGSGKSTLLHLLGCLDRPTEGSVLFGGQDTTQLSLDELARVRNKRIGFVFQGFHLVRGMNALESVALPLQYAGLRRQQRLERARELLASVGLEHREEHRPGELSGGEQQRVAIARALVNDPEVILADEPTGNLDASTGGEIMGMFRRLNRERGVTVILVTHERDIAAAADRIVELADGRIRAARGYRERRR